MKPIGKNSGNGTVVVALYDSEKCENLLDVKLFNDLSKPIEGTFNQSGFVKAMWWASLSDIMPLCDAKGENMEVEAE